VEKPPCAPCAQARLRRLAELTAKAHAELDAANDALVRTTGIEEALPGTGMPPRVITQFIHGPSHKSPL
jgi:hypothetical protein